MHLQSFVAAQLGLPAFATDLIGLAGGLVLVLVIVAFAGYVYRSLTGGIEWPSDEPEDDDGVRPGGQDDEWDYY